LYVVSRSILGSIIPAIVYLVLIFSIGLFSGFTLYSIVLVIVFMLIAVIPGLFTPRRFEFYDSSLKTHKTVGGDTEIPYSDLKLVDNQFRGRGNQILLSVAGQRRPLIIGKNPTNQSLGMDLKQFLTSKLKKTPAPGKDTSPDTNRTGVDNETSTGNPPGM
jgi:hypothetical protein